MSTPSDTSTSDQDGRRLALLREVRATGLVEQTFRASRAHSVGIGRKVVGGRVTDELAVRFHVESKRDAGQLGTEALVPPELRFRSRGTGREEVVPTDVLENPPPVFEQDHTAEHRPVPGGVSVDGITGTAGTLGGWVWDTTDDTIVSLSNHHMYGHVAGVDVIQPAPLDGGSSPTHKIGDVKRGIPRSAVTDNTVDAAIADVDSDELYDLSVLDIGPAVYAIDVAVLDMAVEKSGRTTGHTFGTVSDIDYETTVSGLPFVDCVRIEAAAPSPDWSAGGDSGSLVFSQTPIADGSPIKPVVALHFAGPSVGTYGVVCRIQNVFEQLDLTTVCAGAFASLFDEMARVETEDQAGGASRLTTLTSLASRATSLPGSFAAVAKRRLSAANPHAGLARDVQQRLQVSDRGRQLTTLVDDHRHDLLTLVAKDGDVRRATLGAFRPLLSGATTTDDVLDRPLDAGDLARLRKLSAVTRDRLDPRVVEALEPFLSLVEGAEGRTLGDLLDVRARVG